MEALQLVKNRPYRRKEMYERVRQVDRVLYREPAVLKEHRIHAPIREKREKTAG